MSLGLTEEDPNSNSRSSFLDFMAISGISGKGFIWSPDELLKKSIVYSVTNILYSCSPTEKVLLAMEQLINSLGVWLIDHGAEFQREPKDG